LTTWLKTRQLIKKSNFVIIFIIRIPFFPIKSLPQSSFLVFTVFYCRPEKSKKYILICINNTDWLFFSTKIVSFKWLNIWLMVGEYNHFSETKENKNHLECFIFAWNTALELLFSTSILFLSLSLSRPTLKMWMLKSYGIFLY